MKLTGKYESDAPTEHTRVELQVWSLGCLYEECGHGDVDADTERPRPECPSSTMVACQECSDWNAEYESGAEPWPCENDAVQSWQAAGGKERRYAVVVEAFLRGWNEHRLTAEREIGRHDA